MVETIVTLPETGQVSKVTSKSPINGSIGYDQFNNPTDLWYYDYGQGQPGTFLKREHTEYITDQNYLDRLLWSLPSVRWVSSDINGSVKVSRTHFEYDNYSSDSNHASLVARSSVTGHDSTNYGTGFSYRGNVPGITAYSNAGSQTGAVTKYMQYDILGNVVNTIDGNGNATNIGYADNFGAADNNAITNSTPSQISGYSTFAFPTSVTNPKGWIEYTQYDYFTGVPVNTQDFNELISKTIYNDILDRPTQSVANIDTANEIQTSIEYDDVNRRIEKTSDLFALDDNLARSESFYDALGRTIQSRSYSDGDYVAVDTQYDALGRIKKVSNPYRPSRNETPVWTKSTYDALSRMIEVETSDTAKIKAAFDGNRTLVADQAGKKRISKINAIGQLTDVWEVTASDSSTVSVTFPGTLGSGVSYGYQTSYVYDTLGNLITVDQGDQERAFTYDSLSKLQSAENPESGTISYTYDSNGNLKTKRDARNIKTAYDYDELGRVTKRCYRSVGGGVLGMTTCVGNTETDEPNTEDVTYTYEDINVTNLKGVLTKVTNGTSMTEYTAFNNVGRVTAHKQTTDGQYYTTAYTYNLSGALNEETYPSGRVVKNTLDTDGSLSQVQSKRSGDMYRNYANAIAYTASGAVSAVKLGNGRWETALYNNRLQPFQIALGSGPSAQNLLKLDYSYGEWVSGSIDATKNNGNIVKQINTVPTVGSGTGFTATHKYYYDPLNRIDDSTEEISSSTTWRQDFTYDRYGNRNFHEANTTTLPKNCGSSPNFTVCPADVPIVNPAASTSTNKLIGYTFDPSGNPIEDAEQRTFMYDGENKQVEVKDGQTVTIGQYWYDGSGQRVKKHVPDTGETTIFVYDGSGKLVAEYSTIVASSHNAKLAYLTNDHLGSPRIITDAIGEVIARHDYHSFGQEITVATTSQRTSNLGYNTDNVRRQFTGYERDTETNLDFSQSRMFASSLGRFHSADPRIYGAIAEPASWNHFVYALNNPLVYVDRSGNWPTWIHRLIVEKAFPGLSRKELEQIHAGNYEVDMEKAGTNFNFIPVTLRSQNSPQHSMQSDHYPTHMQMETAKQAFIDQNMATAMNASNRFPDGTPTAPANHAFGRGRHPDHDGTSPAHTGENSYYATPTLLSALLCTLCESARFVSGMQEHSKIESSITPEQLSMAVKAEQGAYLNAFGQKNYDRATTAIGLPSNWLWSMMPSAASSNRQKNGGNSPLTTQYKCTRQQGGGGPKGYVDICGPIIH